MKYFLNKDIIKYNLLLALITLIVGAIGWELAENKIIIFLFVFTQSIIIAVQLAIYSKRQEQFSKIQEQLDQNQFKLLQRCDKNQETYNNLMQKQNMHYKQMEALLSIHSVIKPSMPLPQLRDSAISPDMANIIIQHVLNNKCKTILECGSGVSTLLISYCLKKTGQGRLWSVDHEEKYALITKQNLKAHSANEYTTVIEAPLKNITIKKKQWQWYDTAFLKDIDNIDLLIIDGPPRTVDSMVRYPALPLLFNSLNRHATIILDDASRPAEKDIVENWLKEFQNLSYDFIDTEKGTVILTKE
jgi:predicted O-methyltransferase YrrM